MCAQGSLIKAISHLDYSRGLLWRQETGPLQTIFSQPKRWEQPKLRAEPHLYFLQPPPHRKDYSALRGKRQAGRQTQLREAAAALWPNFPLGPEGILCTLCSSPTPCLLLPGDASPGKQCRRRTRDCYSTFSGGKMIRAKFPRLLPVVSSSLSPSPTPVFHSQESTAYPLHQNSLRFY